MMMMMIFFVIFICISLMILMFYLKPQRSLLGKHVMISGGSSGIGLSVAKQIIQRGGNVTLLARNEKRLKSAKEDVLKLKNSANQDSFGKIQIISADVCESRSHLSDVVHSAEKQFGPVYMLVNCAGFAKPGRFEDISEKDANNMMNVNCMGSFFLTQEVVKSMKSASEGGIIVFVSSQGGLLGIYGYTAYAASKAAVIRLAEALHMEMKPHNITVTVNCPPDTDTPGYAEENKAKPVETAAISESSGLYSPDEIALLLINDSLRGVFLSSPGLEGFLLKTLCAGMSPITDPLSFLAQVFLTPLFRIISAFYHWNHGQIVQKEYQKRQLSKKLE